MSLTRRVASALAASAFGQIVTIGTQVLLTPFFFTHWGAEQYGEWLLLSGIPAYIAMADAGIGSAAGNDMTIRVGAGDTDGAQRTFRGALLVAGGAAILALIIGLFISILLAKTSIFHLKVFGGAYAAGVLIVLSIYVGLNFVGGVVYSGYRCCGRNAMGIAQSNISRLAETVAIGLMLILRQPPIVIAFGMVAVKAISIVAQIFILRGVCKWLFKPRVPADTKLFRRLITPAIAFLAFPMSNALLLQGPLMILGSTMDGTAIAIFSAFRTLARIPFQLSNMLNSSVWPEVSLAYGAQNIELLRRIHSTTVTAATYGAIAASTFILIFGSTIMKHWLHGQVPYDKLLMSSMLVATVVSTVWNGSSIVLSATNRHARYGAVFVVVSAANLLASYPAALYLGLYGIALVMVLTEVAMALFVVNSSLAICDDTFLDLIREVLRVPKNMSAAIRGLLASGNKL